MTQSKIIAIDLGAYDMRISAVVNQQPMLLPLKNRKQKCSSTVAVKKDAIVVGDSAINNSPDAIAFGACRPNGPPTSDVWFNQPNNGVYTFPSRPDDRWYRQQIIAELLKEAVTKASTYLKEKINDVMITVPDHAGQQHRQLLLQAAEIAELNVAQLINQSTAAAAWYWTATKQMSEHNALFVNFGASNITATVMVKSSNHIRPVSAAGDTTLGGEELTQQLMRYFLKKINNNKYQQQEQQEMHQQHINNKKFIKQLRQDCEKAINELSASVEAHVEVTFFDDEIHSETLSRQEFESICHKQFDRIAQIVNAAVTNFHEWAKENGKELRIHRVFLFGGSSQNAKIAEIVQQALGSNKEYYQMETSVIPENAVALGAAALADQHDDPSKSKAIPNCVLQPFYCEVNGVSDRIASVGDYLPITYGQHRLIISQSPASQIVLKANTAVVGSIPLPSGVSKSVIRLTANNLLHLRVASQQNEDYSIHNFEDVVVAGTALLDKTQIITLRETSGRSVADQQQCVRQLTQLVKYFVDKEPPLSASLAQCAEDMVQTIIDYLADAMRSVKLHETSSEYRQLYDRIQSFLNYLKPLKQLYWGHISSTDVNGIASDIKDRLRVLKEKPILQSVGQITFGLPQAQQSSESNSALYGKKSSVQQSTNSSGAGQSYGDRKYNELSQAAAYSTSNAYQAATRYCMTVSVASSTRTDQPLDPLSKTASPSHQQNVEQKEDLQAAQVQKLNLQALKNRAVIKLGVMREMCGVNRTTIASTWIKQLNTANEKVEQAATDSQIYNAFEQLKSDLYRMDDIFYSDLINEGNFSLNELSSPNAATNQQVYSMDNAQKTAAPLGKFVHESGTKEIYQTPESPSHTTTSRHLPNLTQKGELLAVPLQQSDLQTLKNRVFSKLSMMRDPNRFTQTSTWIKLQNTAYEAVQLAATHGQVHDAFEQLKRNIDQKYRDLRSRLEKDGYFSLNESPRPNAAKNRPYQMPSRRWKFW
uniref:Uncharacterized protein n=1 Tax=Plectus sambesii TaxID=2011161 RepID=A0A914WL46_9BILA